MNSKSDETPPPLASMNESPLNKATAGTANPPSATNEYDSTLKWIIPATEETFSAGLAVTQPDLLPIEDLPEQTILPSSLLDTCVTPEIQTPLVESALPMLESTPTATHPPIESADLPQEIALTLTSLETSPSGSLLLVPDPSLEESINPNLEEVANLSPEGSPVPNLNKELDPNSGNTPELNFENILDSIQETPDPSLEKILDRTLIDPPIPTLEPLDHFLEAPPTPSPEKATVGAERLIVSTELHENESGPCEAEVELLESDERLPTSADKEAAEFDRYGPTPPPIPSASALPAVPPLPSSDPPPPVPSSATPPLGFDLPEALARRSLQRSDKPWFEVIFDDDYLRTLPFSTQEQTNQEVEFLSESFSYYPGGHVLDVACGYGRHALPLAKRGFQVTGIDLSLPLLLRAADEAQRLGIPVNFIHTDMREISFQSQFNGAYCTLTSFGYFDEETNLKLAQAICQSLKPGGRFLLDVLNRDYVVSDLPSRVWWEGNGCVVLEEVEFNYQTSRLQIHRSIVFNEGHQVEQDLSLRIYSLHELGKLLRAAGFRVMEISGSVTTRGHFFGAASRQILLLCERPET